MQRTRIKRHKPPRISSKNTERQKPHVCTINQLAEETGMSAYTIRQWVKKGEFRAMKSGKKYLINYDVFMRYLNREGAEIVTPSFGIRRIGE